MEAVLLQDAQVLIPNEAHKNFTRSNQIIKKVTKVIGEPKIIKGLYRGQPFDYNLFYTNNDEIIFMKHIKPKHMNTTEVTLGADAQKTPTTIQIPAQSNLGKAPIIGAVAGAALGFGFAKYKKVDHKHVLIYSAVGAVIGFVAAKFYQSHKDIKISKSK